jgi:CheY-like chemotaxis protein
MAALAHLEADLFGSMRAPSGLPQIRLTTCNQGEQAIAATVEAVQAGTPFAIAFVDLRMPPGLHGLEVAERLREVDPNLHIVIVTAFAELHPVEIARQVPPADRLFFVQKPFHGPEIQQLVNALGAKWRSEMLRQQSALAASRAGNRETAFASAAFDRVPAGIAVFDPDDRLVGINQKLRSFHPEVQDCLERGASYAEVMASMAPGAVGGASPAAAEAWVRSRLLWHETGDGVVEQRLRDGRRILQLESRDAAGRCLCLFVDVTIRGDAETHRADGAAGPQ